jgi:hypothetical protein
MSATVTRTCPYCDYEGDGDDFDREHYGHHGPSTVCPDCGGAF